MDLEVKLFLCESIFEILLKYLLLKNECKQNIDFFRLLRGLAWFDALFLVAAMMSFGLPNLSTWYTDTIFMRLMATLFGLLHTFRTGSVYVTLAVTYERFHSIICPLKKLR